MHSKTKILFISLLTAASLFTSACGVSYHEAQDPREKRQSGSSGSAPWTYGSDNNDSKVISGKKILPSVPTKGFKTPKYDEKIIGAPGSRECTKDSDCLDFQECFGEICVPRGTINLNLSCDTTRCPPEYGDCIQIPGGIHKFCSKFCGLDIHCNAFSTCVPVGPDLSTGHCIPACEHDESCGEGKKCESLEFSDKNYRPNDSYKVCREQKVLYGGESDSDHQCGKDGYRCAEGLECVNYGPFSACRPTCSKEGRNPSQCPFGSISYTKGYCTKKSNVDVDATKESSVMVCTSENHFNRPDEGMACNFERECELGSSTTICIKKNSTLNLGICEATCPLSGPQLCSKGYKCVKVSEAQVMKNQFSFSENTGVCEKE